MQAVQWMVRKLAHPFLERARTVLNGHVYCVIVDAPRLLDRSNFFATAGELLSSPDFADLLTRAVLHEDPSEGYLRCAYTPPTNAVYLQGVSIMTEALARQRLESMLIPCGFYSSPYGRNTAPEEAKAAVDTFLDAFQPRPTLFAEIDPAFMRGWKFVERSHASPAFPDRLDVSALAEGLYEVSSFPDGSCDSAMLLATDSRMALLVNNGSD